MERPLERPCAGLHDNETAQNAWGSVMNENYESTDRTAGDYLLFALVALGQLVAAGGIIVSSVGVAVLGGVLALLGILGIGRRDARLESP